MTYTLAIQPSGLLAVALPTGEDIAAALVRDSKDAGYDMMAKCTLIEGVTLTNDPDETDDYANVVYTDYQGDLIHQTGFKYAVKR